MRESFSKVNIEQLAPIKARSFREADPLLDQFNFLAPLDPPYHPSRPLGSPSGLGLRSLPPLPAPCDPLAHPPLRFPGLASLPTPSSLSLPPCRSSSSKHLLKKVRCISHTLLSNFRAILLILFPLPVSLTNDHFLPLPFSVGPPVCSSSSSFSHVFSLFTLFPLHSLPFLPPPPPPEATAKTIKREDSTVLSKRLISLRTAAWQHDHCSQRCCVLTTSDGSGRARCRGWKWVAVILPVIYL